MRTVQKLALGYLLALLLVFWGYQIGRHEAFPFALIQEMAAFVAGHPLEGDTSVLEKLANDTGLVPNRFLWTYPPVAGASASPLDIPGLRDRRDRPLVMMVPGAARGYRAIFGALDFADVLWGGVLLGPGGEVLHTWRLTTRHLRANRAREEQKDLYGVHLFPDGSVIFSQQETGGGIVKIDACGDVLWNLDGDFHHTVSPTDRGTFWTYAGKQEDFDHVLAEVSAETGEIVRTVDMAEVRRRNPKLHIFNLQKEKNVTDISHGNDIEPLPRGLADRFPDFSPGDLLLSFRTQNLVFVLDPDTLMVKWWRIGAWDRQHDPDWEPDGRIVVFSNNEAAPRAFSDIVAIDPASMASQLLLDGSRLGFYSTFNGDHERTPWDTRMVTSSTQGWVFEVDAEGQVVFSFLNLYDEGAGKALHLSEAVALERDYFDEPFWTRCD